MTKTYERLINGFEQSPTKELLRQVEIALPAHINKKHTISILKEWLFQSGNVLMLLDELFILDELIKKALLEQKMLANEITRKEMENEEKSKNNQRKNHELF